MDPSHTGAEDSNVAKKCESNPSNPTRKNKRSKTSVALNHFNEVDSGDSDSNGGEDSDESDEQKNNTTIMKQMELNCGKDPNQSEDSEGEGSNCSLHGNFFSMKRCRDALCRMIIMEKLPFRIVECEGFRKFSLILQPKFIIPSRKTVVRDCFRLYLEEMRKLKGMLVEKEQRVCLTSETWTSMQNLDYMVLTAHFIDDDWKLQKRILNFSLIPDIKGDTIGQTIEKCLLDWGIEKVFTVTVDNASYNDGGLAYLETKIRNRDGVVLYGDFAHIVNLMVCDALKELHGSIIKIRNAIKYVKSSSEVLENFNNCARDEKISCKSPLCLDVPTKWNSTYTMLDTAVKFQKAFERLEAEDDEFCLEVIGDETKKVPPLSEDWDNASAFLKLLKFFRDVSLRVSVSPSGVTSHRFFYEIFLIKKKIEGYLKSGNSLLADTARNLKVKYETFLKDKEKTNVLLYVSIVLDPRYKLEFVWFALSYYEVERSSEIRKKIEDMTRSLYNEYQTANMESETACTSMDQPSVGDVGEEDDEDHISMFIKYLMQQDAWYKKSELDKYLSEPCERYDETFDVLDWWKINSSKYKILGKMAKDIFVIPLSSNALESDFSTEDRVLDSYHSFLPPKSAEIVICLRNWLCSQKNINTDETTDELELEELEDGNEFIF